MDFYQNIRGTVPVTRKVSQPKQVQRLLILRGLVREHRLILLGLLATAVIVAGTFQLRPLLDRPIARVKVTGSMQHINPESVQRVVSPYLDHRFFELDLNAIKKALVRQPWIDDVSIQREWPNTLLVHLVEQQPLARWGKRGLLNASGKLFYPADLDGTGSLPELSGPSGSERRVMKQYHELGKVLRSVGLSISALTLSDNDSWSFQVGAVVVEIGSNNVVGRLSRFMTVYQQVLATEWSQVKRVDLRYNNGIAVSWLPKVAEGKE